MKKIILLAALLFIGYGANAQEKGSSDYKRDVMELMKLQSGQLKTITNMVDQLSSSIPERNRSAFKKDVNDSMDKLYEQMADIYMETYTKDEIEQMLKFYRSPVGQKISKKAPELMEKSMKAGQVWGMQTLKPLMQKYAAE